MTFRGRVSQLVNSWDSADLWGRHGGADVEELGADAEELGIDCREES